MSRQIDHTSELLDLTPCLTEQRRTKITQVHKFVYCLPNKAPASAFLIWSSLDRYLDTLSSANFLFFSNSILSISWSEGVYTYAFFWLMLRNASVEPVSFSPPASFLNSLITLGVVLSVLDASPKEKNFLDTPL